MSGKQSDRRLDAWVYGGGKGFGNCKPPDELLHSDIKVPGDALTETYAYMIYVPEERISSIIHFWLHPNLNVITAGPMVYQGHKANQLCCEIFDIRAYHDASGLGDGSDMTFASGHRIEILEPFKKIRIRYDDADRGNSLDVVLTSAAPPVMRENNKHFEQICRSQGTLRLRGKSYVIDSFAVRDRSWGELRQESPYPLPPYTWMTAIFPSLRMYWQVSGHDDPELNPEWGSHFELRPEHVFKDGWIQRDGELLRLKSLSKLTTRDPTTRRPMSHQLHFVDAHDREYQVAGEVVASVPWQAWPNMICYMCLTRWTWEGHEGFGDTQEVQWSDYVYTFRSDGSHCA